MNDATQVATASPISPASSFPVMLEAGLRAHEGQNCVTEMPLTERMTWRGARWSGGLSPQGKDRWRLKAVVESGVTEGIAAGLRVRFAAWHPGVFVLIPGAVYGGNRQTSRAFTYAPRLNAAEAVHPHPDLIADIPRLDVAGGPGRLQLRAGDCAWPVFAWWDARTQRAGFIAGPAQTEWGETLWDFEEQGGAQPANLWIGAPGVRARRYTHMTTQTESGDRAPRRAAGDQLGMDFVVREFTTPSVAGLFAELQTWSEEERWSRQAPQSVNQFHAVTAVVTHFDRDFWWEEPGLYGVDLPTAKAPYQSGWCGGIIAQYALLAAPGIAAPTRARASHHLETVATNGMAASGLFFGRWNSEVGWVSDFWWEHEAAPWRAHWTLTRRQADSLYFGVLAAQAGATSLAWARAVHGAAAALAGTWQADRQWGFFLDQNTGGVAVSGSTGGGLVPGALARAAAWANEPTWLRAACAGATAMVKADLARGVTTGGPGDAVLAPDSESVAGLLESLVTLWEITGDRHWLPPATLAAQQLSTWVMPYDYAFPTGSEFARLNMRSAGTVFANAQNKHAAPGLCTHSGWALFRLFRATGETSWLHLAGRIARALPQYVSLPERPIHTPHGLALPSGWINERVNTSDWDNNLGGVFFGPCWSETSLLLTAAELPGVYAQSDTRLTENFDVVTARWCRNELELHNPTAKSAQIRIAVERSAQAPSGSLSAGWVAKLPLVTVLAGKTLRWRSIADDDANGTR